MEYVTQLKPISDYDNSLPPDGSRKLIDNSYKDRWELLNHVDLDFHVAGRCIEFTCDDDYVTRQIHALEVILSS